MRKFQLIKDISSASTGVLKSDEQPRKINVSLHLLLSVFFLCSSVQNCIYRGPHFQHPEASIHILDTHINILV